MMSKDLMPAFVAIRNIRSKWGPRFIVLDAFKERREEVLQHLLEDLRVGLRVGEDSAAPCPSSTPAHLHGWTRLLSETEDKYIEIVRAILEARKADVQRLADLRDAVGRRALDVATHKCRALLEEYLLFCGRYRFSRTVPQYSSATCEVWFTVDASSGSAADGRVVEKEVCLKMMKNKDEYERELACRKGLDDKFIVGACGEESERVTEQFAANVDKLPAQSRFRRKVEGGRGRRSRRGRCTLVGGRFAW